jgi:hypothetical protein
VVFAVCSRADAALQLRLTQDATRVDVNDDDGNGVVSFLGSVGDFAINLTIGYGSPAIGSPSDPKLAVASFSSSSSRAGALTIALSQTDFVGPPTGPDMAAFLTTIVGLTTGSASISTYASMSNEAFGVGPDSVLLSTFSFDDSGSFLVNDLSEFVDLEGEYSLTMVITIEHDESGGRRGIDVTRFRASLDAIPMQLQSMPEPTSLAVWGGAILCAAVMGPRRRRRCVVCPQGRG